MDPDQQASIRHQLKWWLPTIVIVAIIVGLKNDPTAVRIARHFFPNESDPQVPMLFVLAALMLPGYFLFSSLLDVAELARRDGVRLNLIRLVIYLAGEIDHPSAQRHRIVIFGIGGAYLILAIWWIGYASNHGL